MVSLLAWFANLSCLSQVFIVFVQLLWLLIAISKPIMWILVPVLMLPTAAFAWWAKQNPAVEADIVIRLYGGGMVPGALLVLLCELFLMVVFVLVCFSDQLEYLLSELQKGGDMSTLHVNKTVGMFFFIVLAAWIVAAFTEESMKYYLLGRVKQNRPEFGDWRGYLVYAVAPALGFSTIENIGYTSNGSDELTNVVTCITRLFIATPVHCLTGYLLGIGVIRRELFGERLKWYKIMGPAVAFHGFFDYVQFLLAAYGEHLSDEWAYTSSVLEAGLAIVCLVLFALYVWRARRQLVSQYHLQDRPHNAFLQIHDLEPSNNNNTASNVVVPVIDES